MVLINKLCIYTITLNLNVNKKAESINIYRHEQNILTLFLGSFRLNIKLLYLFLYLASVSRKKEKSSFSIFVATFAAFSSGTFKFDSVSLKIRTIQLALGHMKQVTESSAIIVCYLFIRMSFRECLTLCLIWSAEGFEARGAAGCTLGTPFSTFFLFTSCFSWVPDFNKNS